MYLKQVEITGFKSFADKTRLTFEPGMIAIVGPNGCGKSNVSDSIRWVLGEQRPTQLRCAHMSDVVFNGTDTRKQLGMAEVSITFADCESVLGTEFNEVTVSRRVFRGGEGQYFINKVPSRLKDVNRLFMGTGIGTNSYSVMAQGQIDAILSSKPEDRRTVFEEAAGITKFKADRKEALRKLDQTDANLLRLNDVIREVKRQIGTLQRQAGKAKRYKELHDELRGLDLYLTRHRIQELDIRLDAINEALTLLEAKTIDRQNDVADGESAAAAMHSQMHEIEERINLCTEQAAQADNAYIRAQEVIKTNAERIEEYRSWAKRDNLEIDETRQQIEQVRMQLESLAQKKLLTEQAMASERERLDEAQNLFDAHRDELEETRSQLQRDRQRQLQGERRIAEIRQSLDEMEIRQREVILKRDRLNAELAQMKQSLAATDAVRAEIARRLEICRGGADECEARHSALEEEREASATELHSLQEERSRMQSEAAAKRAQLDLLSEASGQGDDYSGGSKLLLDAANPLGIQAGSVLGTLADKISAPAELRLAVEAALRAWLDAVVVKDAETANRLFSALIAHGGNGAAKFVLCTAGGGEVKIEAPFPRLIDELTVSADFDAAAKRLLGNVFLFKKGSDIPEGFLDSYPGASAVSCDGVAIFASGCAELWMPEGTVSSPIARKMFIDQTGLQLQELVSRIDSSGLRQEELSSRISILTADIATIRAELDGHRRAAAQTEGEFQAVDRDAQRAKSRIETVEAELSDISGETAEDDGRRSELGAELETLEAERAQLMLSTQEASSRLEVMEGTYGQLSQRLTDSRIQVSSLAQQLAYASTQAESFQLRIDELEKTIQGRSSGVESYNRSISRLTDEIAQLTASLEPLQSASEELHAKIEAHRQERAAKQRELEAAEATLTEHRRSLDAMRDERNRAELEKQESTMKRQNCFEHAFSEYGLDERAFFAEPEPSWNDYPDKKAPPVHEIETRVSRLNSNIQDLGPVNLVAIEEYKEYEERYAFLKEQEEDLVNAKAEVLNVIQRINTESFEKFRRTFDQANANFQQMFTRLFNGGEARLVMLENKEDPLECGVDIIARPPGKRPQSVTLLSGGERTMTAVSLLFAIFMIKPAPFCILDELDAALDDSNIGRFVDALKGFLAHSQFLIITHNQHTIAGSDMVYGVTQQEKGVSKILSIDLNDVGRKSRGRKSNAKDSEVPEAAPEEKTGEAEERAE